MALFVKQPIFSLFLTLSRCVQLPYLESVVKWLIYHDGLANGSSRVALSSDSVFNKVHYRWPDIDYSSCH